MADENKKLNARQEKFCKLYASDEEFFCNGVQAYIEAYSTKKKKVNYLAAKSSAYDLLTKPYILNRIDELLELNGLNDSFVDKQLEKLITQDADFKSKLGAIKEYNELKKRIKKGLKVELPPEAKFNVKITTVQDDNKLGADKETG